MDDRVKNYLRYGQDCIGQTVHDCDGVTAVVTDMYTKNRSRCLVAMEYADGTTQTREKFCVSLGKFKKPGTFDVDAALKSGTWRPLYGFENYYIVSASGDLVRVKGKNQKRPKVATLHSGGYMTFSLYKDKRSSRKVKFQHRCVVETFIRPLSDDEEVNHIDGDRTNNALYNLEILSKKENNKKFLDMEALGLSDDEQGAIKDYCQKHRMNLKRFIGDCIKNYMAERED